MTRYSEENRFCPDAVFRLAMSVGPPTLCQVTGILEYLDWVQSVNESAGDSDSFWMRKDGVEILLVFRAGEEKGVRATQWRWVDPRTGRNPEEAKNIPADVAEIFKELDR